MATVRPISPQYQHTLDSAIALAKDLASKNMADSGESSPKTPNSPDKKRFNFKLKHFNKSFSEASNNIRDIESCISYEARQAYKSLIERGPYNSSMNVAGSHSRYYTHNSLDAAHSPHSPPHHHSVVSGAVHSPLHHSHTLQHSSSQTSDDSTFCRAFRDSKQQLKHSSAFSVKKSSFF